MIDARIGARHLFGAVLRTLRRLRPARLLAVLAMVLMVGLGQHAHPAVPADGPLATGLVVQGGGHAGGDHDGGGDAPAAAAHCAFCHVARGVAPDPARLPVPVAAPLALPPPPNVRVADLAAPDEPARPPRPVRAAA
jgi:hypothetical protein